MKKEVIAVKKPDKKMKINGMNNNISFKTVQKNTKLLDFENKN